jgi:phi LC3 family holin
MKINWKVRFKNPLFYVQIVLSVLTPILTYLGLTATDLTTWAKLGDVLLKAISNPYVLSLVLVSVYNALVDPTTRGFGDSEQALTYEKPKK